MRKDWIRYGNNVSLDLMKIKYSSLHWPYIGPVGLDNEHRICLFCECLVVSESIENYVLCLQMLEIMEPRRRLRDIRIIFGDGFFNDDFLDKLGLHRPKTHLDTEGTDLIWYFYQLSSDIWPKMFFLSHML